jgi:hypothetical protein
MRVRQHFVYFVLRDAVNGRVPVRVGASGSPIDSAMDRRRNPGAAVLGYAQPGGIGRAKLALSDLRQALQRWELRDGWVMVPVQDGRAFRRCFRTAVERHSFEGARIQIHHIDLKEYSSRFEAVRFNKHNSRPSVAELAAD